MCGELSVGDMIQSVDSTPLDNIVDNQVCPQKNSLLITTPIYPPPALTVLLTAIIFIAATSFSCRILFWFTATFPLDFRHDARKPWFCHHTHTWETAKNIVSAGSKWQRWYPLGSKVSCQQFFHCFAHTWARTRRACRFTLLVYMCFPECFCGIHALVRKFLSLFIPSSTFGCIMHKQTCTHADNNFIPSHWGSRHVGRGSDCVKTISVT